MREGCPGKRRLVAAPSSFETVWFSAGHGIGTVFLSRHKTVIFGVLDFTVVGGARVARGF